MDSSKIHHFDDLFDTSVFYIPKGSIDFDGDGSYTPNLNSTRVCFFLCVISLMRHWMKLVIRKICLK